MRRPGVPKALGVSDDGIVGSIGAGAEEAKDWGGGNAFYKVRGFPRRSTLDPSLRRSRIK